MNIENLLSLIGGLGLFLYGMTVMGESIEKAAGAKMRSFLDFFTKNRCIGMLFVEFGAGRRGNYGCQCRYYHYFTVGRI